MAMDQGDIAFDDIDVTASLLLDAGQPSVGPISGRALPNQTQSGGTLSPSTDYASFSDYAAMLLNSTPQAPAPADPTPAPAATTLPAAALTQPEAAPELDVDLSTYVMIGRYDLPEPTRTVAPGGNLLGQEASGVTYNWDTNTLFIVGDGGTSVTQVSLTGALIDTMTLASGTSPQGTEFYDTESITYVGGGQFVITEERYRQAVKFTYAPGETLTRANTQTVDLGTDIGNVGLEGLTYDPLTSGFIFVKEKDPLSIFQTTIDFDAGTASNGSSSTVNSTNLFDPALAGLSDLSDVYAFSSNAAFVGTSQQGTLLILSQEAGKIVEIDRSGNILSTLVLSAPLTSTGLSLAAMTVEGMTMDAQGRIYLVSEEGGGDFDHPQVWVFASATGENEAPTALALANALSTIIENRDTTSRVKVADVVVTDDGLGTNSFTVTGADAASFEADSSGLYIKAGVTLDYETQTSYSVTVNVDDAAVGGTPDASTNYTLAVTNVVNESANGTVRVTEVAPWASGNSTLGSDWFEITNTGSTAIDISGWKVDDSSASFGSAIALSGITSIAAGESVIFMEVGGSQNAVNQIAAFKTLWFGANVPAGFQVGTYTGSGIGLGTSGDAVNIFDATGTVMANVTFGSSPASAPYATFDNGLGATGAISTLSATGTRGGFVATNSANEIGSPGTVGGVPAPVNKAPTAIGLTSEITTLAEGISTASRVKVAGIVVTDDELGTNMLALTGADAAYFEVDATGLYIKAGVVLDYETKSTYAVTVTVDDASLGATPDASVDFSLTVSDVSEGTVRITEVAPWSSGSSAVGADWFEVTNTGTTAIDISGWKVDDSSAAFGTAAALSGITTIAAGESVIFIESASAGIAASFITNWFGASAPSGLQIGTYTGSGIGLSTGGDGLNLFNATGTLQANISFGSSPAGPFATFDNAAGLNGSAVSTLSIVGTNGAFAAVANAQEIGSPGTIETVVDPDNQAPTAISLPNALAGIDENSGSLQRIKVADVAITDDGKGSNVLSLSGADAAYFTVDATGLYLKPGTTLDYEAKSSYAVTVSVDDAAVGGTPDASVDFTLNVNDIAVETGPTVFISEVAPFASGDSPVGADWFELTNASDSAVDISGWRFDDDSASFAESDPLEGITSLAAGESVIFLNVAASALATTSQAFVDTWFGGVAPAGLRFGNYQGAGLGKSGDAVYLFDAAGTIQHSVAFGAISDTSPFATFDNSAGLDNTVLSSQSQDDVNGAFAITNSQGKTEIGSPGETGRFTLQLLHFSDAEAGALAPSTAHLLAAMVDAFEDDFVHSITLASGDLFLPGPFLAAGTDLSVTPVLNAVSGSTISLTANLPIGAVDVQIMNQIGVQLSAIGNHEFDLGSRVLRDAISPNLGAAGYVGANYAYLSANLDFSGDADLSGRFTQTVGTGTLGNEEASDLKGRIAPSAVIYQGGEPIGFVGATTQMLEQISSPTGTEVKGFATGPGANGETNDMVLLAAQLQLAVDDLIAQGVNKVVIVSHLQDYQYELALAPLLHGVDIIISGGSHARFGDADDQAVAFPGHDADFDQTYPIVTSNADGKTTLIVNTDGEYTYLGRLVVDFDANGDIILGSVTDNVAVNGAYASTEDNVAQAWGDLDGDLSDTAFADGTRGEQVQDLTEVVNDVIIAKDGTIFGYTDVYLEGERQQVRTQETNLGSLSADANASAARTALGLSDDVAIVSIKNGGGIRAQIGTIENGPDGVSVIKQPPETGGEVSQLDIENALRFDNKLMVFDTTAQGLFNILNSPNTLAPNNGGFIQIGGVQFSYDPTLAAGSRVRDVALVDADGNKVAIIANDGVVNPNAPALIQGIVLNFTANGGDGYLFKANADNFRYVKTDGTLSDAVPETLDFTATATIATYAGSSANLLGEQKALADYMADRYGTPETAFDQADTDQTLDTRIQNQSARADTVLAGDFILTGTSGNDVIDALGGNDTLRGREGDDQINGAAGNDAIYFSRGDGFDSVNGGDGTDTIYASENFTRIGLRSIAGIEAITANGYSGVTIIASSANDSFDFSAITLTGIGSIDSGAGDDVVIGSAGNDVIIGGKGNDILSGGEGDDSFLKGPGEGSDAIDGGEGHDQLLASADGTWLNVNSLTSIETISANGHSGVLITGTAAHETLDFSAVTLVGIESINGGGGNDLITGSTANDIIAGGGGNDTIWGGLGDDIFLVAPGGGIDGIHGGDGQDSILATANNSWISLSALSGIETISANGFTPATITGTAAADLLDFSDVTLIDIARISGGGGGDTLIGSAGNDAIMGGAGIDMLTGGAGNDHFVYGSVADSRLLAADHILDFQRGDMIDFREMDANVVAGGKQSFTFRGSDVFNGLGQLRLAMDDGHITLFGNVSGDLRPDFAIVLDNNYVITAADMLLI